MDFRQLETFIYVCKRRSFSKAAKELYISQPTVSNHIQALEEELNATLINRSSKNIVLTQSGELLFDFAQRIMLDKSKLNNTLLQLSNAFTGVIEVISSSVPELYILPYLIQRFSNLYPDVKFKVCHFDSSQVIEELENKNYVFGFTGYMKKGSFLKFHKIADDEMVIIEGKESGFIQSDKPCVNINEILHKPFVVREEGSGSKFFLNNIISPSNSIQLNTVAIAENTQLIKKLVLLNMGISFISKNSISYEEAGKLNIYTLEGMSLKRDLYFSYNPNQYLTTLEEKFKDMIIIDEKNNKFL